MTKIFFFFLDKNFIILFFRYRDIENGKFTSILPEKHCKNNVWLIKPNNQSDGKGIQIFKNLRDIENFIGSRPNKTVWLIQKYIEFPLIYNERKFDLRIWTLITDKNEVYIYKNSFIKTSCFPFNIYNTDNNIIHLTSNSVQKMCSEYGKIEDGNTLGIEILEQLFEDYKTKLKLDTDVFPRIKDIIIDVFLSIRSKINFRHRKNCFELFCFDFLIDNDYRLWLLDVGNTNDIGLNCKFMRNTLPKLIDDIFSLTIDKPFEPLIENFHLGSKENMFEAIYSEFIVKINKRNAFDKTNFYPIPDLIPKNSDGGSGSFADINDKIIDKKYERLYENFDVKK